MKEIKDMTREEKDQEAYTALEQITCLMATVELCLGDTMHEIDKEDFDKARGIMGVVFMMVHHEFKALNKPIKTLLGNDL
jgi:hypothetical protein